MFSQCKNQNGHITADNPNFKGFLELKDILNEKNSGEYLPIFRGKFIRKSLYTDIGTKKSCGIISYIKFAIESGSFWITNDIIRIYYDNQSESITGEWTSEKKAIETVKCYKSLFEYYENLYIDHTPNILKLKKLKLSVYLRLSRQKGYWREYTKGMSIIKWKETLAVGFNAFSWYKCFIYGSKTSKKIGLVRKYG